MDWYNELAAISYMGDLEDITAKFFPSFSEGSPGKDGDCTIVITEMPEGDLAFAHNTHNKYQLMGL